MEIVRYVTLIWMWFQENFFTISINLLCYTANPLHYYALRVLRRRIDVDDWSIFKSRTTGADHITCGTSICIVYSRKLRIGWLYV